MGAGGRVEHLGSAEVGEGCVCLLIFRVFIYLFSTFLYIYLIYLLGEEGLSVCLCVCARFLRRSLVIVP